MCAWIIPPTGLIEPVPSPEFYVEGIGAIEMIGDCIRLYLVSEQMPLDGDGGLPQHVVTVKIVGPVLNVPKVIGQLAQSLWREPRTDAQSAGSGPHLVK